MNQDEHAAASGEQSGRALESAVGGPLSGRFAPEPERSNSWLLKKAARQNPAPVDGGGYRFRWQAEMASRLCSWARES